MPGPRGDRGPPKMGEVTGVRGEEPVNEGKLMGGSTGGLVRSGEEDESKVSRLGRAGGVVGVEKAVVLALAVSSPNQLERSSSSK